MTIELAKSHREILGVLNKHPRWQGRDSDGELLYPMVGRGIRESVLDHTKSSLRRAGHLRNRFKLGGMNPRVISQMLLIHDYAEFYNGDVAVYDRQVNDATKPNEAEEMKRLMTEYELPAEYLELFDSFENWSTTESHSLEAAYARFIDTYDGALMHLMNTYVFWFNGKEPKLQTDFENVRERVFSPLKRMAHLYRFKNIEARTNFFQLVIFVRESISKHFGDFNNEAYMFFERDVCEIGKSLQSI